MAEATTTAHLTCSADEFLAFVLDVERYREVDDKIGPIDWVRTDGNVTEFRFRPTLPGLGPAPKCVSRMTLTPGERIDIRYAPTRENWLVHRLSSFAASFRCTPEGEGIRATRTISIGLPPIVRRLLDPYLQRRLQASIDRELELTQTILARREAGS